MRKYCRIIRAVLWLILLSVLYFHMEQCAASLSACENMAYILLDQPLDGRQAGSMEALEAQQEHPMAFAAWRQDPEVQVKNERLGRSHTVSLVTMQGRSDLVMRGCAALTAQDTDGCLIDKHTALALFGTVQAVGCTIWAGDRQRTVRGILYQAEDTVVLEDPAQSFTDLSIRLEGRVSPETLQQTFFVRHGISGRLIRMDILSYIARLLCAAVPLAAGCVFLGLCFRMAGAHPRERAGILLAAAFLAALLAGITAMRLSLPADLTPTKWSDFDFWRGWWQREKESLLLLLLSEKQKPVQTCLADFYRVLGCALFSNVCIFRVRDILLAFFGKMLL